MLENVGVELEMTFLKVFKFSLDYLFILRFCPSPLIWSHVPALYFLSLSFKRLAFQISSHKLKTIKYVARGCVVPRAFQKLSAQHVWQEWNGTLLLCVLNHFLIYFKGKFLFFLNDTEYSVVSKHYFEVILNMNLILKICIFDLRCNNIINHKRFFLLYKSKP